MAGKSSPEAMERMINNITKFIQVQQSVAQSLKSDYMLNDEDLYINAMNNDSASSYASNVSDSCCC